MAHYNLAKLHLTKHDVARARQAFFRVIDQSSGHELALRAQLKIGQLCLEEEEVPQAIIQLRRAQTLAPKSPYQPLATLLLAAAYLSPDRMLDLIWFELPLKWFAWVMMIVAAVTVFLHGQNSGGQAAHLG